MSLHWLPSGAPAVWAVTALLVWAVATVWTVRQGRVGVPFAVFLACLFTFLLSRPALTLLGVRSRQSRGLLGTNFHDEDTLTGVFVLLTVCLTGLLLGAIVGHRLLRARGRRPGGDAEDDAGAAPPAVRPVSRSVRTTGLALFLVTGLCRVLVIAEGSSAVATTGFYELRVAASHAYPYAVYWLAETNALAACLVLAAAPSRPLRRMLLAAFVLLAGLSLLTWQRADFGLTLVFALTYLVWSEPALHRRRVILTTGAVLAVAAVPLTALLGHLDVLRGRSLVAAAERLPAPVEFLYSQGVSVNVLGHVIELRKQLPADRVFSLGPLMEYALWNLGLGGDPTPPTGQTAERALSGHQLSHTLSYLVMPDMYLKGSGYGSSFAAELWLDGGTPLVLLGSVLLGALLIALPHGMQHRVLLVRVVALLVLLEIPFTPRSSFSSAVVHLLSTPMLLGLALCVLFSLPVDRLLSPRRSAAPPLNQHGTRAAARVPARPGSIWRPMASKAVRRHQRRRPGVTDAAPRSRRRWRRAHRG